MGSTAAVNVWSLLNMLFIESAYISIPPSQGEKCRLMHIITVTVC